VTETQNHVFSLNDVENILFNTKVIYLKLLIENILSHFVKCRNWQKNF